MQLAADHHRSTLLLKYFSMWQLYIQQENQHREIEAGQDKTRSKMAAFLEAAASGRLWSARAETECDTDTCDRPDTDRTDSLVCYLITQIIYF